MENILHHLNKIQDNRKNQGKRYQLKSILGLVLVGYIAGCNSLSKIHLFGKQLSKANRRKLGFLREMPSHPTITETIRKIDPDEFEKVLSQIVDKESDATFTQIAIDGKSIRSTSSSKEGLLHLVSAFAPEISGVLSQVKSGLGGGEISAADKILSKLNIQGKVITGDVMFAQEVLTSKTVGASGDYVFKVKGNKKRIHERSDESRLEAVYI